MKLLPDQLVGECVRQLVLFAQAMLAMVLLVAMVPGLCWKELSARVRNDATLPFLVLPHEHSAHTYRAGIRFNDESEDCIRQTEGFRVAKSYLQPFDRVLGFRCPFVGSLRREEVCQGCSQCRVFGDILHQSVADS